MKHVAGVDIKIEIAKVMDMEIDQIDIKKIVVRLKVVTCLSYHIRRLAAAVPEGRSGIERHAEYHKIGIFVTGRRISEDTLSEHYCILRIIYCKLSHIEPHLAHCGDVCDIVSLSNTITELFRD